MTDPDTGPLDAPPPPPSPPYRSLRFVRARDRKLGGVAGGLATTAGLDPTLVRIGMVVGALTGWVVLLYLLAWILLPDEDESAGRPLRPAPEDTARLLRIGLAVVAGLGALQVAGIVAGVAFALLGTIGALFQPFIDPFAGDFGGFNPDFPVRGIVGLILLIGGGSFLLRRRGGVDAGSPGDAAASSPGPAAEASGGPSAERNWRSGTEWLLLGTRAGGWLVALWFSLGGALLAALWALDVVRLRFPVLIALATLGALGLMGTMLVRSRRPAVMAASAAAMLVPILLVLTLGNWNGVAGYRVVTPVSMAEVPEVYRHAFGELRLDLSGLSLPAETAEVKVEMGAGEATITVPWNATVEASARVGAGEFNLFGRSQAGLSLNGEVRSDGEPGGPTLRVLSRVSAGQIKVFRRSPPVTKIALDEGRAVRLQCNEEVAGLRCTSSDRYPTPALECLVSSELETMCRPPGQVLAVDDFPGDRTGLRRCAVPPGGGLATCTASPEAATAPPSATGAAPAPPAAPPAPAPPEQPAPPPAMPPGTYLCEFPPGGGAASCRPA